MRKIFAVTALIACSQLHAQSDTTTLNEVVVTATKYPVKQSNTGKVITVINRQQIERSLGKDLALLLNEQAGVNVNGAFSNPGKDKTVYLRGAGSSYTLFLLDGIPLNDPSGVGGTFDIRLIPLEQIERIEILKGSQSTLYGANAIAGVINIISRKATTPEINGSGALSYGSYGTFKGNAHFSRRAGRVDYSLNYEYFDTDGISEARDTTGAANFDKDGFNRQAFSAVLGFQVADRVRLAPYFRFSEFRGAYDGGAFLDSKAKYNASLFNTGLAATIGYGKGTITALYGYDRTLRNYNGFGFEGRFHHAEAYVNHTIVPQLQLLAGLSYQSYYLPTPDTVSSILSPFASLVYQSHGLNVELGGRYNKHNKYGDNFTYSFNPSYLINGKLKIFANLSTGYRAPSISELFGPFGANPALKPEKSRSIEGGLQAFLLNDRLSALATYFNRDIEDVIIYGANGYTNRDRQQDQGVELELAFNPTAQWSLKATYAYVTGELTQTLTTRDTSFNNLLRRPKHTVNLTAGYQATRALFVSSSMQCVGERSDVYYTPSFTAEPRVLKAFLIWNAYVEYKLTKAGINLFMDVRNILDNTDYYEVYGYNVQGATVNGGLRFKL